MVVEEKIELFCISPELFCISPKHAKELRKYGYEDQEKGDTEDDGPCAVRLLV